MDRTTTPTRTISRSTILDFILAAGLDPERVTHLSINPSEVNVDYIRETGGALNIAGESVPDYRTQPIELTIVEGDE